jgi:hypothetical protein
MKKAILILLLSPLLCFAMNREKTPSLATIGFQNGKMTKNKKPFEKDFYLKEGDRIVTEKGSLRLDFLEGSQIFMSPETELKINEFKKEKVGNVDNYYITFALIKGRLRATVQKIYNIDSGSSFKILTEIGEARVRGTDFVLGFYKDKTKREMRVETLEGSVQLASLDLENKIWVNAGDTANYVVTTKAPDVNSGVMSQLTRMADAYLLTLRKFFSSNRDLEKQITKDICKNPRADFNQCYWECVGNPKSAGKKCLVEKKNVSCVRKRCDGDGNWSDPTVLPINTGVECVGNAIHVGVCDY